MATQGLSRVSAINAGPPAIPTCFYFWLSIVILRWVPAQGHPVDRRACSLNLLAERLKISRHLIKAVLQLFLAFQYFI